MSLAPWRAPLARALHRNRSQPQARYLQLATVGSDGRPANRTVVFRGFSDSGPEPGNALLMVTDKRSRKVAQINQQPWVEACWYFPKTREQFRLAGLIACADDRSTDQALRQRTWESLSDAARLQFSWPTPKELRALPVAFAGQNVELGSPLPTFCVLRLTPIQVDHLELRGHPQNRCLYEYQQHQHQQPCHSPSTAAWSVTLVNP